MFYKGVAMRKTIVLFTAIIFLFTALVSCTQKNKNSEEESSSTAVVSTTDSSGENESGTSEASEEGSTIIDEQKIIDDLCDKYDTFLRIEKGELAVDENDVRDVVFGGETYAYAKVIDAAFLTVADLDAFFHSMYCSETADEMTNSFSTESNGAPCYTEIEGFLYRMDEYPGRGYPNQWTPEEATVTENSDGTLTVTMPYLSMGEPGEVFTILLIHDGENWVINESDAVS